MSDNESPGSDSACFTSVESSWTRGVSRKTASIVSDAPTHKYQPLLSKQHTRRLILAPGTVDDSLVGSLEMIELGNTVELAPFEAISYVCGSNIKCHTITIDERPLAITESLSQALRQTRPKDRPRPLWADAICINQDDSEEKNQQVALMGHIYQKSRCTLMCFGLDPKDARHACDVAMLIGDVNNMMETVFGNEDFSWD